MNVSKIENYFEWKNSHCFLKFYLVHQCTSTFSRTVFTAVDVHSNWIVKKIDEIKQVQYLKFKMIKNIII